MKKTILIFAAGLIAQSVSFAENLPQSDDCFVTVMGLTKGLTLSYKEYNQKEAQLVSVELTSATETREYVATIKHNSSVDTYKIELENDSAYKCLLRSIKPVEIGG